jgi:hypothetical protein
MGRRLKEVIERYLVKNGSEGKTQLSLTLHKAPRTIDRWLKDGITSAHNAYKLALACGCSEEEALELSKECSSRPRRTA